jgi:tripartite-type tricarboxylate transporter receptor subunit TctC
MTTQLGRRSLLAAGCGAVIAPCVRAAAPAASAAGWPSRPVRLIVGYPPGGSVDNAARVLAQALSERLPQPVIVDNRPGADGTIGVAAVIRSGSDGHTLLVSVKGAMTVAPSISKLSFDPSRDLLPLAPIAQTAEVFVARPRAGIESLRGVPDAFKRHGSKLSIGYIGAYPRLLAELLSQLTSAPLLKVPYKGLPQAMQDLLGDQIDMLVGDATGLVVEQVKAGKLVALAVTSERRLPILLNVPTVAEVGMPALTGAQWYALFGPAGMTAPLAAAVSEAAAAALATPDAMAQLAKFGLERMPATPNDLEHLMSTETAFWKRVAQQAHITPE